MEHKNLIVCKANKVIEAGYKLSLMEHRLIQACVAQVNSKEELVSTKKFELSAKDFAKLYEISEASAYDELKQVSKQLFHRYVTIENPDPEQPKIKQTITHWITSIDYIPDDGKIVLFFAPKILPYLGQLKGNFTFYRLDHVRKMTCIYAIRLYELLMQWKATGTREVEIAWLKKQFQLDASYDRMDNFKRRVIKPAIKDINTHSNFLVAWEQRKTGRNVTHLIFTFAEKAAEPNTAPTAKNPRKAKGKMINGVIQSEIEAKARPGESYEGAAERIKAEKLKAVETKLKSKTKKVVTDSPTEPEPKTVKTNKQAADEGIRNLKAVLGK
jgi:plasmid replication initiation protein